MQKQNKQPGNHKVNFLPQFLWMIIFVLLFVDVTGATAWYRQGVQNANYLSLAQIPIHKPKTTSSTNPNLKPLK